jgi:hypothetical protein
MCIGWLFYLITPRIFSVFEISRSTARAREGARPPLVKQNFPLGYPAGASSLCLDTCQTEILHTGDLCMYEKKIGVCNFGAHHPLILLFLLIYKY